MSQKVYEYITEQIIKDIQNTNILPWQPHWSNKSPALPFNALTGKHYRGANIMLLMASANARGFTSSAWGSWKQWATLGGTVHEDERKKFTKAVLFKWVNSDPEDKNSKEFPLLRYFRVYNVAQVDIDFDEVVTELTPSEAIIKSTEIWEAYQERVGMGDIRHGFDTPKYFPLEDFIGMPVIDSYNDLEFYVDDLNHEIIHSTGRVGRLERPAVMAATYQDDPTAKAFEELVAEIGASMLSITAGIRTPWEQQEDIEYIKNWLTYLEDNPQAIIRASGHAQKAVDYILGVTYE